jgi:hypothetical protein
MTQPSLFTSFDVSVFDLNPHQSFSTTDSVPSTHDEDPQATDDNDGAFPSIVYTTSINDKNAISKFTLLYQDLCRENSTLAVVTDDKHFESAMQIANELPPNPEIHYLATSIRDLESTSPGERFDFFIAVVPLHQENYARVFRTIRPHLQLLSAVLVVDISDSGSQILDPNTLVQNEGFRLVHME